MDGQKTKSYTSSVKVRHHHKPYLLRHLTLLVTSSWLVFVGILGAILSQLPSGPSPKVLSVQTAKAADSRAVFNKGGLVFSYDASLLEVKEQRDLVQVYPYSSYDAVQASIRLTIQTNGGALEPAKTGTRLLDSTQEHFAGTNFQKNTFIHMVTIGGQEYETYSLEWRGQKESGTTTIRLEGLQNPNIMPASFGTVLDTLMFGTGGKVLGSEQTLPPSYAIDAVSPAVVKIYRVTCGTLVVDGQQVGGEHCDASSGSGFFVSSDGHIATSGHVVTREAEDVLAKVLLNSPASLNNFLKYLGLSDQQVSTVGSRPELLAAVIARLYDAPPDIINLKNKRSALIVSLGTTPLKIESEQDARSLLELRDTDHIKHAELVGSNYSPKDLFVLASGEDTGFSASDVALLKVSAKDTPYLEIFSGPVTQTQTVSILGFPGDADNILTDNKTLSVTATNGSIGAIRVAAGSSYTLYQSDADASQGSSGGPVITENGQVLGLLTYRYKNASASDAAKSYIRDIADIKKLAKDEGVSLMAEGTAQDNWVKGLKLFSENRFSKAISEFRSVKDSYPAHRLAVSYIRAAEGGIAAGHEVKDVPLAAAAAVSFTGAAGASGGVVLIARHHSRHLAYKLANSKQTFTPHHAGS